MTCTTMEWYEQIFEHAIDAARYENIVLAHMSEDVSDYWKPGDLSTEQILSLLLKEKKIVRVDWGGDDVRYYFPDEIAFKGHT